MSESLCRFCGINLSRTGHMACAGCASLEDDFGWMVYNVGVPAPQRAKRRLFARDASPLSDVQRWFLDARKLAAAAKLLEAFENAEPVGVFNVEGGSVDVSTRLRESCELCFDDYVIHRSCEACGRAPENTVRVSSGLGDGEYGAWTSADGDALLLAFDRAEGMAPTTEHTLAQLGKAAPLPLARVITDGMFAIADPGHFPVFTAIPAGVYEAVAWIAPLAGRFDMGGPTLLRPVALTLTPSKTSGQLIDGADAALSRFGLVRFQVAAAIWGSPAIPTASHIEPTPHLNLKLMNQAFCASEVEWGRDDAWSMLMALDALSDPSSMADVGGMDTWIQWLQDPEPELPAIQARCLLTIGREDMAIARLRVGAGMGDPVAMFVLPRWEATHAAGEPLLPAWGVNSVLQAMFDLEMGTAPAKWIDDVTVNAAWLGYGPAVGNLTWEALLRGNFDFGIAAYDAFAAAAHEVMPSLATLLADDVSAELGDHLLDSLLNNESNAALLHLARGDDPSASLQTWTRLAAQGRTECAAYAALLRQRLGNANAVAELLASLSIEERELFAATIVDALASSDVGTWAHAWFTDLSGSWNAR